MARWSLTPVVDLGAITTAAVARQVACVYAKASERDRVIVRFTNASGRRTALDWQSGDEYTIRMLDDV
jgi:hypothetical protein